MVRRYERQAVSQPIRALWRPLTHNTLISFGTDIWCKLLQSKRVKQTTYVNARQDIQLLTIQKSNLTLHRHLRTTPSILTPVTMCTALQVRTARIVQQIYDDRRLYLLKPSINHTQKSGLKPPLTLIWF